MILRECLICDEKYKDYDDERDAICKKCYRVGAAKKILTELIAARAVCIEAERHIDFMEHCGFKDDKLKTALATWREYSEWNK